MRSPFILTTFVCMLVLGACSASAASSSQQPIHLRLGYFPNVTHAAAVVGVAQGIFATALGPGVVLDTRTFNAGPTATEALLSGSLDATFIGPNPAINAFIKSGGTAIRIISGATSGGAFLIVRNGINTPADLRGTHIATPQLGNTQDVALRSWLAQQGFTTNVEGGGDVSIMPQDNAQTLQDFMSGQIDGAWVPEPWATRMVKNGGGHVLVDERDLWPGGQYVTTQLIVRTDFLVQHPDAVKALLQGQLMATDYINNHPSDAQATLGGALMQLTGSTLSPDVIAASWNNLTFTVDPIASSLQASANAAQKLGFIDSSNLTGIYDLKLLNEVLGTAGRPLISQP